MRTERTIAIMAAIWFASALAFGLGFGISVRRIPPTWFFVWLTALPLLGLPLSLLLHAAVRRFEHLGLAGRWLRLTPLLLTVVLLQASYDHWMWGVLSGRTSVGGFAAGTAFNFVLYIWLFGLQALVLELLVASDRAKLSGRRAVEAMEAARSAQLEALSNQLNPHMLFNTFNSLSALVLLGRNAEAEAMIARISEFMRACLDGSNMVLIPLADELDLLASYVQIETGHLPCAAGVSIDCPAELTDAQIPRLILQPLIENALKYAVHPSGGRAGVSVSIAEAGGSLSITVKDDGPGAAAAQGVVGTGRGLSIVARRLETLFGKDAQVSAGALGAGFRVELSLPLRRETGPGIA